MPRTFTLQDHPNLAGPMGLLFEQLRARITEQFSGVSVSVFKGYIAFVHANHFVDVLPRKRSLRLLLNIPFQMMLDPKERCKDIQGTFGPFEAEFVLAQSEDLDYCLALVQQAYDRDLR